MLPSALVKKGRVVVTSQDSFWYFTSPESPETPRPSSLAFSAAEDRERTTKTFVLAPVEGKVKVI